MSLFGKMNQRKQKRRRDHPENNHGGAGGRRVAKLYITSDDFPYLPTHRKISQVEHAAVAGRISWLLLTYSCTAGWCGTELRVCRRRIVRVEATVIPGAVRF